MTEQNYLRRLLAANDATQAMQAATDHVQRSLSCDVSWSGLAQGEYLVIGAHSGLRTHEMATVWKLKIGEGIGGRAAHEGRPHKSNDYQHDSRRVPAKRIVDNEGIVAILVVPILLAERALGVIYAGYRSPHVWRQEEIAAVEQISHDLAVRLKQLDADGELQLEASASHERAELLETRLRSSVRLLDGLARVVEVGATLEAAAAAFDLSVEVRDEHGQLLGSAGAADGGSEEHSATGLAEEIEGLRISVRVDEALPERDCLSEELALGAIRLQLLRLRERERTTERLRGDLVDQLLTGRILDPAGLVRRLALIGMSWMTQGTQVLVLGAAQGGRVPQRLLLALQATFPNSVVEHRDGRAAVLLERGELGERALRDRLTVLLERERTDVVIGIGRVCAELMDFSMSYDEAYAACEVGLAEAERLGGRASGNVVSARRLGIQGLASMPLAQLQTTITDTFGPLIESDERRGTELVPTIRAYLSNDRHIPDTAEALRVHYNTVRNRVARIEDLLGVDFSSVDDRFRLETALRMEAMVRALSKRGSHPGTP